MRTLSFLLIILFFSCKSEELSQTQISLKKNSVNIKILSELPNKIYKKISNYNILMIGEMHGTNEPAEFAYGVCKLIDEKEGKVIMAMEIPPSQMENYNQNMTVNQLKELNFFNGENSSGMNGNAWLNLIAGCNKHNNIIVEFFDLQTESPRDSSMYNGILEIRSKHPKTKIVTLSGNLHNWLEPFNEKKMLGKYLMDDKVNFDGDKIMSIMHYYNQGTMMNNIGNGLELRTIEPKENIFNKTLSNDILFSNNIFNDKNHFTHILYTEKVTHSEPINNR